MSLHSIKECWECDGVLFKKEKNAKLRSTASGKEVIPHSINAGVRETKAAAEVN